MLGEAYNLINRPCHRAVYVKGKKSENSMTQRFDYVQIAPQVKVCDPSALVNHGGNDTQTALARQASLNGVWVYRGDLMIAHQDCFIFLKKSSLKNHISSKLHKLSNS